MRLFRKYRNKKEEVKEIEYYTNIHEIPAYNYFNASQNHYYLRKNADIFNPKKEEGKEDLIAALFSQYIDKFGIPKQMLYEVDFLKKYYIYKLSAIETNDQTNNDLAEIEKKRYEGQKPKDNNEKFDYEKSCLQIKTILKIDFDIYKIRLVEFLKYIELINERD